MLHQLLSVLQQQPSAPLALLALGGAGIGGFLWLAGSRFNQWLVTLMLVALGAWIGLFVPRWFGLPVSTWATAIGGALVLGVMGFGLHRLCVGMGLAFMLAFWVAMCLITQNGVPDKLPALVPPLAMAAWLQQAWEAVPMELRRAGLFGCGFAAAAGLGVSILWPRLAAWLFYSLLGATLMVGLAMVAMVLGNRPQLLRIIPADPAVQLATLAGLVVFGAAVQWRTAPRAAGSKPAARPKEA